MALASRLVGGGAILSEPSGCSANGRRTMARGGPICGREASLVETCSTRRLLAPYALAALPGSERAAVEDHLVTCTWCRTEVAELSDTASSLAEWGDTRLCRVWRRVVEAIGGGRSEPDAGLAKLVGAATAGDKDAWDALVQRFNPLVWAVVRGSRLSLSEAARTSHTTWMRLATHLHDIRQPDRLGVWLATTAREESVRALRRAQRWPVLERGADRGHTADVDELEPAVLHDDDAAALWRAFESLPPRCKLLLRLLIADPAPSEAEVSAVLGVPVARLERTRAGCLAQLR